jgi:radical SAM protein with 4Fe4S-binding SPASM domain
VTLYGADTKTYESVTLSKGSFKRCLRGIRLLRRAKINLSLKATVNILNFGQVFAMKKYSAKLGLDFRFDATIHPRLDKDKANCLWRIGADTAAGFDVKDLDRKRSWKEYLVKFNNKRSGRRIFRCLGGQNSFNIDPYGELNICDMFYGQGYDLFSGSFMQGWNDFIPKFLKGEYSKKTACLACPAVDFCDQCPGWSWLENNDIKKARVEYLCQIAYNRVRLLGWGK